MKEPVNNTNYSKKLSDAKQWIILSLILFIGTFIIYFYPFLQSGDTFIEWVTGESYKTHYSKYWINQLISPLILLISLSYLIYGVVKYISLRKKQILNNPHEGKR